MKDDIQKPVKKTKSNKIVLIGDSNVGKTSIIDQFIEGKFGDTKPSIGALHKLKSIQISSGEEVQLDIWDTAGQEKFRSIVPMYYKGSRGIMVIYDVTSKESFEGAKKWISDIEASSNPAVILLIGNKSDLDDNREVTSDVVSSYINSKGNGIGGYIECSAKANSNIYEAFKLMAEKIPKGNETSTNSVLSIKNSQNKEGGGYCGCM